MGKPVQSSLPMAMGLRHLGHRAGVQLLALVREVVRGAGKQEALARDLGISETLFSQALNSQRTQHLEWLPVLMAHDHERKILNFLARECWCRVTPIEPLTDCEWRERVQGALTRAGRAGEAILADALGAEADLPAEEEGSR